MSKISPVFEDKCFPSRTRTEPCPNPSEVFLPPVWLPPLWMSCHFSFSKGFSFSKWIFINFDGIHSFSSPVETRIKCLPQRNTSPDFHFEVSTSLKYMVDLIQKLFLLSNVSQLLLFPLRKFKVNKALCNLFLGVFSISFCLFSISLIVWFDLSITAWPVGLFDIPLICFIL